MAVFKIATWNVNSLKVRLEHVLEWLKTTQPDVLALQEIKMQTADFPIDVFREAGYHAVVSGQKTYNGVAILSKQPAHIETVLTDFPGYVDEQRRVLGVEINGVFILNLYVPNGSEVGSDKYLYKLIWLDHLKNHLASILNKHQKVIVLGDFNIAPTNEDVHDPELWRGQILVSDKERAAWQSILNLGLIDCYKKLPVGETKYSWWDYRQAAFRRDMGLRIDHVVANAMMADHLQGCEIDKVPRTWERPSDHAPVIANFIF
ncbi:MAG: exodeoxyribonuclease III [Pseudomonadota bacterium]